ncbi:unnamed protein product [Prunus brigantina]
MGFMGIKQREGGRFIKTHYSVLAKGKSLLTNPCHTTIANKFF